MLPRDLGSVAATAVIALAVAYPFAAMAGIVPVAQPLFGVCLAVAWILGVSWLAPQLDYWWSRRRGRRDLDRLDHEPIRQFELRPASPMRGRPCFWNAMREPEERTWDLAPAMGTRVGCHAPNRARTAAIPGTSSARSTT